MNFQTFFLNPSSYDFLLIIGAIWVLFVGVIKKDESFLFSGKSSIILLLVVIAITLLKGSKPNIALSYSPSNFINHIKVLIALASVFSIILALEWLELKGFMRFEYPVFILFALFGLFVCLSATNFLTLFLGIELHAIPLYFLVSYKRRAYRSTIVGSKILSLGLVFSAIFIYGMSLVYGFVGSLDFSYIKDFIITNDKVPTGLLFGFFLMILALIFRAGCFPLFKLMTDIDEGAPYPVTAFLLVVPKIAFIAIIALLFHGFSGLFTKHFSEILMLISVFIILYGAILCLRQSNLKRLFSSQAVIIGGYALMAIATGEKAGINAMLLILLSYAVSMIGIFSILLTFKRKIEIFENTNELCGMVKNNFLLSLMFCFFMFSMLGLPPFTMFFGLYEVINFLVEKELWGIIFTLLVAIGVTVSSYIKLISLMFFASPKEAFDKAPFSNIFVVSCCFFIVILTSIYPDWLAVYIDKASSSLFFL